MNSFKIMGNKIRHLEFYGFPDQNAFNTASNIDLSEIKETNKNQDKEIGEISGETQNKADLSLVLGLSGKVDTFMEGQMNINNEFANSISGMTDKINEIADDVNDIETSLVNVNDALSEHIEEFNAFKDAVTEGLNEKLDASVADDTYAKKSEVYSREEADETFLKEHQDISSLATKDELEEAENALTEEFTNELESKFSLCATKEELAEVNDKIDSIDFDSFVTEEELEAFSGEVMSYEESTNSAIENLNSSVSAIDDSVSRIDEDIDEMNDSIIIINNEIESIQTEMNTKATKSELASAIEGTDAMIRSLNNTKADKTDISALTNSLNSLSDSLDAEVQNRIDGDNNIKASISSFTQNIDGRFSNVNDDISSLRDDLNQEIVDRKSGDIALIGTESDVSADDTIWGAKKYAEVQKNIAVNQSKMYTDERVSGIVNTVDNELDSINTRLSGKAEKTYVDGLVNDRVSGLNESLNDRIDSEVSLLNTKDENLQTEINELKEAVYSSDTKDIYKRLNVITTYSGDTVEGYTDEGNGVLDVLHKEFHKLEDEISYLQNDTIVKTNDYETALGHYNISNTSFYPSGRTIFSVGIGTSVYDRKNAIEIRENGDIYMWVENEFIPINGLLAMLANELY